MPTYRDPRSRCVASSRRGKPGAGDMYDADQYAAVLIMRGLSDSTVRNYRCLYQRWLDWCITVDTDSANPDATQVRAWSKTIHGSRSMLAQASAMMGHLCELLDVPSVQNAIPVPRAPRGQSRALSIEDAMKLEAAAHYAGTGGTAVLVGLYTAARRGEIAGMEWEHVDFQGGRIRWWRPKVRDWHTVPLHPVLAEHLEQRVGGQWLFPGRYGGHVSPAQVWRWVLDVADQAGIGKVTPHQLRHTSITTAHDASHDLRAAQDLAGHEDPSVTVRYTRKNEERLREVVSMIDYRVIKPSRVFSQP